MVVRPAQFWLNPTGNLAEEYSVYIGVPNQDPTQPSSQITVMDGLSGAAIAQPFVVTNGIARNTQGQQILPTIIAQRYSIKYVDNDGVEIYSEEDFFSDAFGLEQDPALTADRILDNLQEALVLELDDLEYIFIKSEESDWQQNPPGPDLNTYFYYTGVVDAGRAGTIETDPITGLFTGIFYDALGNKWQIVDQPYVSATGNIPQTINGEKTFLNNMALANDKYFYIQGTNGEIEGPNAIRFKVKDDGAYELDQKDDTGTDWVGIESVLSTGEKVTTAQKNSFIEGLITSNNKPVVFRNSSGESEGEGAYQLINDSSDILRIKGYKNSVSINRLIISLESIAIFDGNGIAFARLEGGSGTTDEITVITREKGDARYARVENFQLTTTSDINLPSGWSVSRSTPGTSQTLTVTHNLGVRLYPVISKGAASSATPYILTSETNSFKIVASSQFGTATNVMVKI